MLRDRVERAYANALEKLANMSGAADMATKAINGTRKFLQNTGTQGVAHGRQLMQETRRVPLGRASTAQVLQHSAGRGLRAYSNALRKNPLTVAGGTAAVVGTTGYAATGQ